MKNNKIPLSSPDTPVYLPPGDIEKVGGQLPSGTLPPPPPPPTKLN